ncbi:MAG: molybdate ABC transporter permease subunit [Planctomycetota bacterium]
MNSIWLSLSVGFCATLVNLAPATALAWIIERSRLPGRATLQTLILLPLVLPPVVIGYALLKLFSPRGFLGAALADIGFPVAFHWLGAVVAAAVVGLPLFVLTIALAFKSVDPRLELMSRTLGRTRWQTFWCVLLPLAWPGILAGAIISFARGLGEFGATIILAGRIPGETETIPLQIYAELDAPGGESRIVWLVAAALGICLVCVFLARALDRRHLLRLELDR